MRQGSGQYRLRLGHITPLLRRSFERACRLPQNPRALQCSYKLQRKLQAGFVGRNPKDQLQTAERKKISPLTLTRIQVLESLGFKWNCSVAAVTAWEDRLSELAVYHKIHGHCNVPTYYGGNIKLAKWVENQRTSYRLRREGKTLCMTLSRIQKLESLGFEWEVCSSPAWETV
jgi:hypothetical protein